MMMLWIGIFFCKCTYSLVKQEHIKKKQNINKYIKNLTINFIGMMNKVVTASFHMLKLQIYVTLTAKLELLFYYIHLNLIVNTAFMIVVLARTT